MESTNTINHIAQSYIDKIRAKCEIVKPKVVINCITFNHENYIRDAIEGFIKQKTDFPFVAIVHDDASIDGTADIIRYYADKYPDIILPIFETKNQYSKRDGSITRIMHNARIATGAEYVAMCEGDDYWIDSHKLQKQADILDNNSSINLVYSGFELVNHYNKPVSNITYEKYQQISYSGNLLRQLVQSNFVMTVSVMYRTNVFSLSFIQDFPYKLDYLYAVASSLFGDAYYFQQKMVAYRMLNTGMMGSQKKFVDETIIKIKYHVISYFLSNKLYIGKMDKFCALLSMSEVMMIDFVKNGFAKQYSIKLAKRHPFIMFLSPLGLAGKILKKLTTLIVCKK